MAVAEQRFSSPISNYHKSPLPLSDCHVMTFLCGKRRLGGFLLGKWSRGSGALLLLLLLLRLLHDTVPFPNLEDSGWYGGERESFFRRVNCWRVDGGVGLRIQEGIEEMRGVLGGWGRSPLQQRCQWPPHPATSCRSLCQTHSYCGCTNCTTHNYEDRGEHRYKWIKVKKNKKYVVYM